jgi:hypothetical protein
MKLQFSRQIVKNNLISNFIKIRPLGAELYHADRRTDGGTDLTNLRVAIGGSANAPGFVIYSH